MVANTSGNYNTAVGQAALDANTTGSYNTAIGEKAMTVSTDTTDCTSVGRGSFQALTTGSNNTGVGKDVGQSLTTGGSNTLVGRRAGSSLTTGSHNVCLGIAAGLDQISTGDNNLFIARSNTGPYSAATWIYGDNSGACSQGNNSSTWSTASDQRLKKDIVANTVGLSIIDNLTVRNFKYKQYSDGSPVTSDDTVDMSEFPKADGVHQVLLCQGKTETQIGIIAQELESVAPNCVNTDERGIKTVNTDDLFWHMLNAIKELSAKNEALEARIKTLEG